MTQEWPSIDYLDWRETCSALHLYLQIVGKYRLAQTPWLNHSCHATFYVDASGLDHLGHPGRTGHRVRVDLIHHRLIGRAGNGRIEEMPLGPSTVAGFHAAFTAMISRLGGDPSFDGSPNEVPDPVPFAQDPPRRGPMTPRR